MMTTMNILCTNSLDSHDGTDPKKFLGNPHVFQKLRKRDRVGGGRGLAVMEVEVETEVEEARVKDEEEKEDREGDRRRKREKRGSPRQKALGRRERATSPRPGRTSEESSEYETEEGLEGRGRKRCCEETREKKRETWRCRGSGMCVRRMKL